MSEPPVNDLLTVVQAISIIDAVPVAPRVIDIALDQSEGLRLAEDLHADRDYPPFDKSLMDGYAVRCADLAKTPVELEVAGESAAGRPSSVALSARKAIAIMTGAPLPAGADGVVPVEDTEPLDSGRVVRILQPALPRRYIARAGSDAPEGHVVLKAGVVMRAAQIAVAATVGATRLKVFARPMATVLATGDELIARETTPKPEQIRNSNSPMLVALLKKLGCDVRDAGAVADQPELIRNALTEAGQSELLFVTGGMSMGVYDYVPRLLKEMGAQLLITKLRIKPGKPFVFARWPGDRPRYVFGLPGNPVSSYVCTLRLATRLIARMSGGAPKNPQRPARLTSALPANGPREFYQPAVLNGGDVTPLGWKSSADLFTLAAANALIVRPENDSPQPAGGTVQILDL